MKIPLSWLRDYVDINLTVEELGQRLTLAGIEVAATERIGCLLYTSDAADERSSVDLGGRRIIKKKKLVSIYSTLTDTINTY